MTLKKLLRGITTFLLLFLFLTGARAQEDTLTVFTEKNPLIYEDAWDLWPYSFLNDKGEADGYNIELIRMLMKELDIPYVIRLKPQQEAFVDLKEGRSDLMLGLAVGFHDEYGLYSKNAVTLFTQSVVTPKGQSIEVKTFRDLGKPGNKVIVNDSSLCHHLMIDYGWEANAIPSNDIREAIQQVSAKEEGQIVWNTLSLKWLINRYHFDNLELTPVNMPHGEYKFMAQSQQLLDKLDDAYTKLYTAEKITPLQNKWFYPEYQKQGLPNWIWYLLAILALLMIILAVYTISYRLQNKRLTRSNNKLNRRLALVLHASQVRLWTYDIQKNQFAWRNDNGQVAYTYSMEEFAQRYSPEDFARLKGALDELASQKKPEDGHEKEITMNLRAKDTEGGDHELRDFVIVLSVLRRDKEGIPTMIIGTKKDITEEQEKLRLEEERTLRYWSIFYTPVVGILLFDKDGLLVNINPKACEMYQCEEDEIIDEHVTIRDFLDLGNLALDEVDDYHASQLVNLDKIPDDQRKIKSIHRKGKLCNEFRLMTVHDDKGALIHVFAVFRNITDTVTNLEKHNQESERLEAVRAVLKEYEGYTDGVLHESDVRLVTYSPASHTLTIFRSVNEVQHALTQTRCMTLVDEYSKKLAMRTLGDMDERADKDIKVNIRTTLRVKGGMRLNVQFCLMPLHDKQGQVEQYFGLLRDRSDLRDLERRLAIETAKVQEVENTKNSFVKNMVQEIRKPMDTVVDYVNRLDPNAPSADEAALSKGIFDNADVLLHLIDNILYLSRLEAHMVELLPQPRDFAQLFEAQCAVGWDKSQNSLTSYIVENPYEELIVDIDAENLAQAIKQVVSNAAQHTASGFVRARYDYIGRRLIISIEDSGEGISAEELKRIEETTAQGAHFTKGLGLAITRELVSQMGGTFEINSEQGSGTIVYIMIPCHASSIKRKKIA